MKTLRIITLYCFFIICSLVLFGCGDSSHEMSLFTENLSDKELIAFTEGCRKSIVSKFQKLEGILNECLNETEEQDKPEMSMFLALCISEKDTYGWFDGIISDRSRLDVCVKELQKRGYNTSGLDYESILDEEQNRRMMYEMILPLIPENELPVELRQNKPT